MRCEFKKMGNDVVKSITLKNIIAGIKPLVISMILAILTLAALIAILSWRFDQPRVNDEVKVIMNAAKVLLIMSVSYQFYSWYKQSREWCDNKGKDDV